MTRQRRVLLDELRALHCHPTADELFHRVRGRLPRISLGTVYRNLDLLCRSGEVRRLESGSGPARYDGDLRPHYHLRCTRCGRLEDVDAALVRGPEYPAASPGGIAITGHEMLLLGCCPGCREREAELNTAVCRNAPPGE
jgi:Fur family ferric uptake transcriptional regulator